MQLLPQEDEEKDEPKWLAYASTIWTLRALWTLSYTKKRYDTDDITPTPKEQLMLLTDELLLASLKLQGRISQEELDYKEVEGNRFGVFMGIESIHQILDRLSKEFLYYQSIGELADEMVQLDEIKRDWLRSLKELTERDNSKDFVRGVGHLLDQLAVFTLQLPALIKRL